MKSVLISLKPYYYYLVGENIKKIEVRKSIPQSNDWDRTAFFYMSKDEKSFAMIPKELQEKYRKHFGKVGLQFFCDRIDEIKPIYEFYKEIGYDLDDKQLKETCLTREELKEYGKRKPLYGWHISNLKIYDKPKELGEFRVPCKFAYSNYEKGTCYEDCIQGKLEDCRNFCLPITSPFQSWGYIERD